MMNLIGEQLKTRKRNDAINLPQVNSHTHIDGGEVAVAGPSSMKISEAERIEQQTAKAAFRHFR